MEESGKMIADSAERLGSVMQELRDLLVSPPLHPPSWSWPHQARMQVSAERNPELSQDEVVLKAQETLEEVSI